MKILKAHCKSYKYAVRGIYIAFRHEKSMIFHLAAAIAVVATNILLKISKTEWLITLILIGLAWMAEIFNTAIERLADRITKEQDPLIGQAKDLAAGAVLVIGAVAVACAVIIYLPYLVA